MDLFNLCLLLLFLSEMGFCSGEELVLPAGLYGIKGRSVNFTAVVPAFTEALFVTWRFTPRTGFSVPIVTSSHLSERVSESYSSRVKYYWSSYTLELNSLIHADNGIYILTIVDSNLDQLVGRTRLVVLTPVAEVSITSNLPEAVEYNSTVVFTCSAKGSFLSYTWLNNSAPVVVDGKHVVQNNNQLIISEVFRTDLQGPIHCTAKNQLESETSSAFNLAINYGPDRITIKREPADDVLKNGSTVILSCSAQSVPAAEFTWLFNDVKLPPKNSTVILSNVGIQQSGNYSCIAYNSKTKRYATSELTTLTVIETGKIHSDGQFSDRTIVTIAIAVLLLLEIIVVVFVSFKH
ncbi:carcinoembryonic antigen-related cell adhesion molecule 1-like isoform X1 [Silurus meridionalis]|uniref:carcinoembryonic antigen-related cell adhesion molecule 1-like isoform X1 n=1 Tax=Silurus meridionalis TaxID=175797 RepID=UPI001EECC7CC|nr:carcinoembryonic antigen-related cell adhesion molecule 1-like isoform X1 [Silurus meridionalis]